MATATRIKPPEEKRIKLHPRETRLEDALIAPQYVEKLKTLGYVSVEQVLAVADMQLVRPRLGAYLGADVSQVLDKVPKRQIAPQLSLRVRTATYKFGSRLKRAAKAVLPHSDLSAARHVPASKLTAKPPATPLGNAPDVFFGGPTGSMPPIRDQAYRGTCVAHAAVAVFEHYLIQNRGASRGTVDLSEQFLYWKCKATDGDPQGEGTFLEVAVPLLFSDGCCAESTWPYNPNPIPGNEGQDPPPPAAKGEAAGNKIPGFKQLTSTSVQEIKDELAAGRCVAVSLAVFDESWTTASIRSSGIVTMPIPGGESNEGHAVCLVGYEDLDGEPQLGGGRFILRNSWNSYWGVDCDFGTGYGTLPYAYVTTYCDEAYSMG